MTVLCLIFAGLWTSESRAENYAFDTKATEVRFTYQLGFVSQSALFAEVMGTVDFNERTPQRSRVDAVIKTASLKAGEPIIENELKGSSFFNVAAQPEIRFKSRAVKSTGKNSAELTGDLTMNGVTRPVTLQVAFYPKGSTVPAQNGTQAAAGPFFSATTQIKRSAFNMTAYEFLVADEVGIEINAPLRKK
jgi:polyisoprenoid-binding protein YceI